MTRAAAGTPFRLTDSLPTGTSVLEASAGTGKTFAIAGLTARYVAEQAVPIDAIAILTFSRAAARELKGRVRDRLVSAAQALADPGGAGADDVLLPVLAGADPAVVAERRHRLWRAVAAFDTAGIGTIHQFSARALTRLGMSGDSDPAERFEDRPADVVEDVVETLYVTDLLAAADSPPPFDPRVALSIATGATDHPDAALLPAASADAADRARVAFAARARDAVRRRRRDAARYHHDDQLFRLRDVLVDPVHGPAAVARVREHVQVLLVDEFQDTDAVQWDILRALAHGHGPLVLIGDPKQAIYGFRNADVRTYLAAASAASERRTLDHNWRSDPDVVRALGDVLGGIRLGDERIRVHPVSPALPGSRLSGAGPALRLRVLDRSTAATYQEQLVSSAARKAIAADLADEVVGLLDGPARIGPVGGARRRVRPGDVAVVVRTGPQADLVHTTLRERGIPAVLAGVRDVFLSPAVAQWLAVLDALDAPGRPDLLRTAAATALLGLTAELGDDAAALDDLATRLPGLRRLWADRGVLALLDDLVRDGLATRLVAEPGGDRLLTDVRHVAEVLHTTAADERLSTAAQRDWVRAQRRRASDEEGGERSRRLETDEQAVQVLTVHAAKGLEFPIVLLPFGAFTFGGWDEPTCLRVHQDGVRALFVGAHAGRAAALARHRSDEVEEELRTLYVALTRASSQVVAWWAPTTVTRDSSLHRVLFGARPDGTVPQSCPVPSDEAALAHLRRLADRSSGRVGVEPVGGPVAGARRWTPVPAAPADLAVARFDRTLDLPWRRTSYTGLTAGLHHEPEVGSETDDPEQTDEPPAGGPAPGSAELPGDAPGDPERIRLQELPSSWADLPGGTGFGTLVHGLLDGLDTAATDLASEVQARVDVALARRVGPPVAGGALSAGLVAALDTPLGPLAGGLRLRDVAPADRRCELGFELPMAGGDRASRAAADAVLADVATLLRRHLPDGDPLAGYADRLAEPGLGGQHLRGYLLGSLDAVLRVPHPTVPGAVTYLVVDYKTNLLRDADGAVTPWAYRPAALADAMIASHYPLQAVLYAVALHRFLRWRLGPGYDPGVHLGGVQYHFLRGMVGPDAALRDAAGKPTGQVAGVFAWPVPPALVVALSDLIATGAGAP
jgi:exodeoxyribonuclease V beta subunit